MTALQLTPHPGDDRLDDYVDGLLDAAAHEDTRAHVAACASCAVRLEELRGLLALSATARRGEAPPAELWPLVVAATVQRAPLRRQLLRSMRAPLAAAALILVLLSSATTAWVVTRGSALVHGTNGAAPSLPTVLADDAALDRTLAGRDHDHGPIARERIGELRRELATVDAALRRAPDDEALYRALADRERVLNDIRPVLGRAPRAPRAPLP